jgi:hypothetical protein
VVICLCVESFIRLIVDEFNRWVEDSLEGLEWFIFDFCQWPMAKSQKLFVELLMR